MKGVTVTTMWIHSPLLCLYVLLSLCMFSPAEAIARPNRRPINRNLVISSSRGTPGLSQYSFERNMQDFIRPGNGKNQYDAEAMHQLSLLKQDAMPLLDADDFDIYRTERAATKALMMEGGHDVSNLLHDSELGSFYRQTLRSIREIQSMFRFSVQESHDGYVFSREQQGRKFLELDIQFDIKRGVDPQITIMDTVSFRYDPLYNRTVLEYGFRF